MESAARSLSECEVIGDILFIGPPRSVSICSPSQRWARVVSSSIPLQSREDGGAHLIIRFYAKKNCNFYH